MLCCILFEKSCLFCLKVLKFCSSHLRSSCKWTQFLCVAVFLFFHLTSCPMPYWLAPFIPALQVSHAGSCWGPVRFHYRHRDVSGLSLLFHLSVRLPLFIYHTVLITIALSLLLDGERPLACLFYRSFLVYLTLCFQI